MQMALFNKSKKLGGLIKPQLQYFKSTLSSNSFSLNHPLWWHHESCSVCYVTNNIKVHFRIVYYFFMQFQVKGTQIYFDTYFPCISNYWARPRSLQKILYFNWGSNKQKSL